jgi:SAM-dependent methyltransferase
LNIIGSKRSVLEIGLGDGHFLLACGSEGNLVSGLDISKIAVCRATTLFKDAAMTAQVKVGDASCITFPSDSFDFVVSKDLVEHIREKDLPIHLREVRRVLKPKGCYLLWTPSKLLGHTSLGTHLKEYSLAEILMVLRKNGFEPVVLSLPLFLATKSVKSIRNEKVTAFLLSYEKIVDKVLKGLNIEIQHPVMYLVVPPICISAYKVEKEKNVR